MNADNLERIKTELMRDEGFKLQSYYDTVGKLSVGVGRNLDDNPLTAEEIAVVGHNARVKPISRGSAAYLLTADINRTIKALDRSLAWWVTLSAVRQRVVLNMAFNLGIGGLLGFHNTLTAIRTGDYHGAAAGMLSSKWAKQVGARADRLAIMMRTGVTP